MKVRDIIRKLLKNKLSLICSIFIILLIIAGIFAPFFTKHNPLEMDLSKKFLSMSLEYPMGTDNMGRCIFCRIIHGIRPTIGLSLIACFISAAFGIFIGMISGFNGGIIDTIIMRLCDILYSFPSLVLTLVIVSFLGPGITNIIIALILVQWIWYARVSRNLTIRERDLNYIEASKLLGTSIFKILLKDILPNIFPEILAILTIDFGHTILAVSGFSFLGLGVKAPFPEWGMMISDGRAFMHSNPMLMFWPGIMILLVVLSSNIIGDNLRDAFEEITT